MPATIRETNFSPHVERGKVRDIYTGSDGTLILVTTDRISAFDRVLNQQIPYKGQALNASSAYTFENSTDIVPNHFIEMPHPNVMIVERSEPYPIEAVVRGYLSGSAWRRYAAGERVFFGTRLPEGLRKNQALLPVLGKPLHTPTTKAKTGHDVDLTPKEVYDLVGRRAWEWVCEKATGLFIRANKWTKRNRYVMADTKYEFSPIGLVDEAHTHDSSRFFKMATYQERFERCEDPEWVDKEFVRNHLKSIGFMGDGEVPDLPDWVVQRDSELVIESVHALTGGAFTPLEPSEDEIQEVVYTRMKR